ncbi:hypothetical protein DTO282E5_444 [Paecilomyces variotii]|nr:hypothetical protein DTO282E5_444 [Paecilomyces variotii]
MTTMTHEQAAQSISWGLAIKLNGMGLENEMFTTRAAEYKGKDRVQGGELPGWDDDYKRSAWFGQAYHRLTQGSSLPGDDGYSWFAGFLWKEHRLYGKLMCIPETKVASILRDAHDLAGHWKKRATLARISRWVYWPNQATDVEDYIRGRLEKMAFSGRRGRIFRTLSQA